VGSVDKLGAESRPVIAAALWMRTAPAQIGGLGCVRIWQEMD
jgi:hypothetical protein